MKEPQTTTLAIDLPNARTGGRLCSAKRLQTTDRTYQGGWLRICGKRYARKPRKMDAAKQTDDRGNAQS